MATILELIQAVEQGHPLPDKVEGKLYIARHETGGLYASPMTASKADGRAEVLLEIPFVCDLAAHEQDEAIAALQKEINDIKDQAQIRINELEIQALRLQQGSQREQAA